MHPYFKHLIEDIRAAHCIQPSDNIYGNACNVAENPDSFSFSQHTFGYYCGLQPENFPPAAQFCAEEIKMVNKAFKNMMATYHCTVNLPENLPAAMEYSILVDTLHKKITQPGNGPVRFDCCSGFPPDCVFKEHCSCLNIWNSLPEQDMEAYGF